MNLGTKIRDLTAGQLANDNDYFPVALNDGTTVKIPWSEIIAKIIENNIDGTNGISIDKTNNVATAGLNFSDLGMITAPSSMSPDSFYVVHTPSGIQKIAWGSIYGQLLLGSIKQGDHITLTQKTSFPFEVTISADAGRDGTDGVTPHIDNTTKHWMIGETDTNVVAEGQDGTNGVTPHIDDSSKHWIIGEVDTGIVAEGQNGEQGQQGVQGNDGYSVAITVSLITGGHRLVISSTDPEVPDQIIDVMDGNAGGYTGTNGITVAGNEISANLGSGLSLNQATGEIDVVGKQSQITTSPLLTLTADGWDSSTMRQTVSFLHDTSRRNVIDITAGENTAWAAYGVYAVSETATGITFECSEIPETALTFRVTSMEVC